MSRTLLFHRRFLGYSGGHGKVRDYFGHVLARADWTPEVFFSTGLSHDQNPWSDVPERIANEWRPDQANTLFLGGLDWRGYPEDRPGLPVINLIQHVRHADPESDAYPFLSRRAIRICVSQPVADAILATGRVNGPLEVIEAALTMPAVVLPPTRRGVFIDALKQPELGRQLADALQAAAYRVDLNLIHTPRAEYLQRLAAAEVAVLLPNVTEGFYLPALEAMALGCATVVPDCIGNRAYLEPGRNALVPAMTRDALLAAVAALDDPTLRQRLIDAGPATVARFDLSRERERFHAILDNLDQLWKA